MRATGLPAQPRRPLESALGFSAAAHVLVAALAIGLARSAPSPPPGDAAAHPLSLENLVWLNRPGPGGGGGGGGNRMPGPVRVAEAPGTGPVSMPAVELATVAPVTPPPADAPDAEPRLDVPLQFAGASLDTRPGSLDGTARGSTSLGPGSGGGAGTGRGSGVGEGIGPGIGPGSGGGTGGGNRGPGSGTESPIVILEVKPLYTHEAMRARIEGTAWLECVVLPDGTVGDVRVVRSLDGSYGLDQEAIKAARRWRFRPGRQAGRPVPMLVAIGMDFHLR